MSSIYKDINNNNNKTQMTRVQFKSNTKRNLEKICEETRVTPTNENYVAVPGQFSMVERTCVSRSVSNQLTNNKGIDTDTGDTHSERECGCVELPSSTFAIATN